MADNIPDAAGCLRLEGWRQGCLIQPNNAQQIIESSIDYYNKGASPDTWLVILTQDCDLVRNTDVEPFVELLALQTLSNKPSNPMKGQSARTLHLTFKIDNQIYWFECCIHDRFRIKKNALCGAGCNTKLVFQENELRLLRQWLARRYTRAAFPDNFEKYLASTKDPVKKLFKSAAAKLISTVYIAIDNEEAGMDEDYVIHVILTVLAEDFEEDEKRASIDEFEERFITVFSNRPHIRFALKYPDDSASYDVRVLSEEDVTLSILRNYKRFDADYRSVDDDAISPPENIDVN
jgi:hypothetical protein